MIQAKFPRSMMVSVTAHPVSVKTVISDFLTRTGRGAGHAILYAGNDFVVTIRADGEGLDMHYTNAPERTMIVEAFWQLVGIDLTSGIIKLSASIEKEPLSLTSLYNAER